MPLNTSPSNEFELLTLSNGTVLLFLMATEAEYLQELQKLIKPAIVGVGPVESAINSTRILNQLNPKPDYVILVGSAGSSSLQQGEVYQASSVSYRDMDASALGFKKGETPFLDQPCNIALAPIIPTVPSATLSTGANIVLTEQFETIDADMADMESYAVMRVCQIFGIPLIVLRGISDGPKEIKQYDDWTELLPIVDANLASALRKMTSHLENV